MNKTHKVGRDPKTGEFITTKKTGSNPDRYIIERVPNRGYGDTK